MAPEGQENMEIPYEEKGFEVQDDLYEQIGRLDGQTQTIIRLRFFEELSLNEMKKTPFYVRRSLGRRLSRRPGGGI